MEKVFIYILMIVCVLELGSSSVDITVGPNTCTDYYYTDDINEAYLTYNGAALEKEECYVRFLLHTTYLQTQCVKAVSSQGIACSTKIEVHDFFISEYLEPERLYTCTNVSYKEWCGKGRTGTVYIVFRTNGRSSNTNIKVHVSLKKLPKEKDLWAVDSDSTSTAAIVVPIIVLISTIVAITVVVVICRRRQLAGRPQYLGQNYAHSQQVPMQPIYQQQQQQMQQPPPPLPGNYQMHPMQTAYPVHDGHTASPLLYNQQPPVGQASSPLGYNPHQPGGQAGGPHGYNPHQPVGQSGDPLAFNPQQTGCPMVYNQQQPSAPSDDKMDPPSYSSVMQ